MEKKWLFSWLGCFKIEDTHFKIKDTFKIYWPKQKNNNIRKVSKKIKWRQTSSLEDISKSQRKGRLEKNSKIHLVEGWIKHPWQTYIINILSSTTANNKYSSFPHGQSSPILLSLYYYKNDTSILPEFSKVPSKLVTFPILTRQREQPVGKLIRMFALNYRFTKAIILLWLYTSISYSLSTYSWMERMFADVKMQLMFNISVPSQQIGVLYLTPWKILGHSMFPHALFRLL